MLDKQLADPSTQVRSAAQSPELRLLYETAPVGLAFLTPDCRYQLINRRLCEICGISVDDHIGRSVRETLPQLAEQVENIVQTILRTGNSITGIELNGQRSDGGNANRVWNTNWYPLIAADGSILGINVASEEITERKRMEAALASSEVKFRELADNISQFAWTADAKGWIYWYNKRWYDYTGTILEEMQGWGWQKVHHPEHVDRVVRRIRQSFETGTPWEDTFPLRSKGGDYRWFLSRALPIRNETGEVIRWFGTNTDVTEQIEAEKALREGEARLALANTMLERERDNKLLSVQATTASIAHEIRQPLGAISLNANAALQCLEKTPPDHDEVRDALIDIAQSVKATTDVLDGLRMLFGKGDQSREPVDVNQLVRSVLRSLSARTKNQGIDVELELTDGLPLVTGHGGQLQEVIQNLVNNAIEAMEAPDRRRLLSVKTELRSEPVIAVLVEDTGPGIDPARIEEIFTPFVTTKAKGTGLGLAISRMIVEGHGGQLTAASDGKSGTSFQFVLPIG